MFELWMRLKIFKRILSQPISFSILFPRKIETNRIAVLVWNSFSFSSQNFIHLQTPIITTNDCEGAGDVFTVEKQGERNGEQFFGQNAFLTVSGQLHAEAFACSLNRVYTFGPTFRAECEQNRFNFQRASS